MLLRCMGSSWNVRMFSRRSNKNTKLKLARKKLMENLISLTNNKNLSKANNEKMLSRRMVINNMTIKIVIKCWLKHLLNILKRRKGIRRNDDQLSCKY